MDTVTDAVTDTKLNDSPEVLRSTLRTESAKNLSDSTLHGLVHVAVIQFMRAGRRLNPSQGNVL